MNKASTSNASGFTLIEVILYLGIVSLFMVGMLTFAWDIMYGREKAVVQLAVEQSARAVMNRVAYEARRADDFTLVSSTEVQFGSDGETITINLSDGSIQLNGADLTSNQVVVTNFVLTDLSAAGSKQLGIELSVEAAAAGAGQQYDAQFDLNQSVELNTQFSQSRRLLVDLSELTLSPNNRDIEGIRLENTGQSTVVIDQIETSWSGTSGGENLIAIQINGEDVEWTGSASSGSMIDIADISLAAGESMDIDYFSFDDQVDGGSIMQTYLLGDASSLPTRYELASAPGGPPEPEPTPTPTPTPSPEPSPTSTPTPPPPTSCVTYCQAQGFGSGSCEKNAGQCNKNGQTHLGAGDSFCTGGPNADTCCCIP